MLQLTVIRLEKTESTISWLKEHLLELDHTKATAVVAEEQTAGQGRMKGRVWSSPPGVNCYFSLCFFKEIPPEEMIYLTQLLAGTLCESLKKRGFSSYLKEPNDLMIAGRKVGGVVTHIVEQEGVKGIILSAGINVNTSAESLSAVGQPATSLFIESGLKLDREALLQEWLPLIAQVFERFSREGFTPFRQQIEKLFHH